MVRLDVSRAWVCLAMVATMTCATHAQYTHAWTQFLNGPTANSAEGSARTVVDPEGNIYHLGTVGMQQGGISADFSLTKYSKFGSVVWSISFNADGNSQDIAEDLVVKDGYVYVAGRVSRPTNWYSDSDLQTLKFDADNGQLMWQRTFSGDFVSGLESSVDGARALTVGPNGEVYVTGFTWEWSYTFSNADFCTVKYDTNGAQQWVKKYHGGATYIAISDQAYLDAVDSEGNLIISGDSPGPNNSSEIATIKYRASDGEVMWAHRSGSLDTNMRGVPYSLLVASNDDVYTVGMVFNNRLGLIRHAKDTGQARWFHYSFVGHLANRASADLAAEDDVVVGVTYDPDVDDSNLNNNSRVIRFNGDTGAKEWTRDYGTSVFGDYQAVRAIEVLPNDTILMAGLGVNTPYNNRMMFLQYSPTGTLEWSYIHEANPIVVQIKDAIVDALGGVIIGGHANGPSATTDLITLKFAPQLESVAPDVAIADEGDWFYGRPADASQSDDVRIGYLPSVDAVTKVRFIGKALVTGVSSISFELEASASRTDLVAIVRAKNYQTHSWETLGVAGVTQPDSTFTRSVNANPSRFVNPGSLELELQVEWVPLQDVMSEDGWLMSIDCVRWNIHH